MKQIGLERDVRGIGGFPQPAVDGQGSVFQHPREVLDDPTMPRSDKRALLAAWASDACAVEGRPAWRQLPGSGTLVAVDDILEALQALDRRAFH